MSKKEQLLNYLLQNSNDKGEIKILQSELSKILDITDVYIRNVFKEFINEGIMEKQGKNIKLINKNKQVVEATTSNLNYSDREKELLQYIYDTFQNRDLNYDYVCVSRDMISQNTSIKNFKHITEYVNKFINDGLIEKIQGSMKEKQANKYKVLFGSGNNITGCNITIVENNTGTINNIQNQYNTTINNEMLEKIFNKITDLEKDVKEMKEENAKLKTSLQYHVNRYSKIEGVAEMLLDYINELEGDIYNIYDINNIKVPKLEHKCDIRDIRRYLDED